MDENRLKELKERAERATKAAAQIEILKNATPHLFGATLKFRSDKGEDVLDEITLKQVIEIGRLELIRQHEATLESLLADPVPKPKMEPQVSFYAKPRDEF